MTRAFRCAIGVVLVAATAACTQAGSASQSNSYAIVDSLLGASGATPTQFGGVLASDVLTLVNQQIGGQQVRVPTVFEDLGQVTFRLGLKDPGTQASPTTPTTTNYITFTRYHVTYVRSDGHNVEGTDVPYGFDGAMTLTARDSPVSSTFTLVRIQAKEEAPLLALIGGGGAGAISTIAQVTFYGLDQSGRSVSVSASISVNFADWGDPSS